MEIALVITSVMSVSFLFAYIHTSSKLTAVSKGFTQLFIAHTALQDGLDQKVDKSDQDMHKENFIKFLSDSRDWAYQYIEDVQAGLDKFIKEVEPSVNHFNNFGIITEGMPHYKDMKKISEQFEELKKFLPEATDDRR